MTGIRTVIHDRRIDVPAPSELPDGTEVLVELSTITPHIGIDESEWRDDPAAIADWAAWLDTIEPIEFSPSDSFDEEFRRFNVEAIRDKMSGQG